MGHTVCEDCGAEIDDSTLLYCNAMWGNIEDDTIECLSCGGNNLVESKGESNENY